MAHTANHTPGPLTVDRHGILNEYGEALFVTGSDGTVWWQNADDAALFAAAPDLYEALKNAISQLEAHGFDGLSSGAYAAIAKAEGRS